MRTTIEYKLGNHNLTDEVCSEVEDLLNRFLNSNLNLDEEMVRLEFCQALDMLAGHRLLCSAYLELEYELVTFLRLHRRLAKRRKPVVTALNDIRNAIKGNLWSTSMGGQ